MNLPESSPKPPKWFFLATDALLLGVALFIAANSERPLPLHATLAIVGCVLTGALITSAAFIADYARRQEDGLDERQNALETLSRTVATSAEQIGIAISGLSEVTDLAHKQLKQAEQLPQKLQEKINDFTRQLNEAAVTENEMLQQEINTLRTAEAEKLETTIEKIAKATAELAKLESAAAKHLAATTAALSAIPDLLTKARSEAEQSLLAAQASSLKAIETRFSDLTRKPTPTPVEAPAGPVSDTLPVALPVETEPELPTPAEAVEVPVAAVASTPADEFPAPSAETSVAEDPAPKKVRAPRKAKADHEEPVVAADPKPDTPTTPPEPQDEFTLVSPDQPEPENRISSHASGDGATRLSVTAYIGIGNRLFIRGEGPGLSPEKGLPLQFISIGKWRWETSAATGPVRVRLYKNDETECGALGEITLETGRETEVTANF